MASDPITLCRDCIYCVIRESADEQGNITRREMRCHLLPPQADGSHPETWDANFCAFGQLGGEER